MRAIFNCENGHIETIVAETTEKAVTEFCGLYNHNAPEEFMVHNLDDIVKAGVVVVFRAA